MYIIRCLLTYKAKFESEAAMLQEKLQIANATLIAADVRYKNYQVLYPQGELKKHKELLDSVIQEKDHLKSTYEELNKRYKELQVLLSQAQQESAHFQEKIKETEETAHQLIVKRNIIHLSQL